MFEHNNREGQTIKRPKNLDLRELDFFIKQFSRGCKGLVSKT